MVREPIIYLKLQYGSEIVRRLRKLEWDSINFLQDADIYQTKNIDSFNKWLADRIYKIFYDESPLTGAELGDRLTSSAVRKKPVLNKNELLNISLIIKQMKEDNKFTRNIFISEIYKKLSENIIHISKTDVNHIKRFNRNILNLAKKDKSYVKTALKFDKVQEILFQKIDKYDLDILPKWSKDYVLSAYEKGALKSDKLINITIDDRIQRHILDKGKLARLKLVYQRNFLSLKNITEEQESKIKTALTDSIIEGKGAKQTAKAISQAVKRPRFRARLIARTELNLAYNRGSIDQGTAYGQAIGESARFDWIAGNDAKVRPLHRSFADNGPYSSAKISEMLNVSPFNCRCIITRHVEN